MNLNPILKEIIKLRKRSTQMKADNANHVELVEKRQYAVLPS